MCLEILLLLHSLQKQFLSYTCKVFLHKIIAAEIYANVFLVGFHIKHCG